MPALQVDDVAGPERAARELDERLRTTGVGTAAARTSCARASSCRSTVAVTVQPIVWPACAAVVSASAPLEPRGGAVDRPLPLDHGDSFGVHVSRSQRTALPKRRVPVTAGCRVGVGGATS